MVYHLDGYWFLISKLMVDVSDENEVKRKTGRQTVRESTVGLGHLASLLFCWAWGPAGNGTPNTYCWLTQKRNQVLTVLVIVKMKGHSGSYRHRRVSESYYLTLSLPTFSNGPRNFFPSHSVLLMPTMRSQF